MRVLGLGGQGIGGGRVLEGKVRVLGFGGQGIGRVAFCELEMGMLELEQLDGM